MSASRIALLSLLLGLSAMVAMPQGGSAQEGQRSESVDVVAENRGTMPVGVYALADGHMVLLDVVEAGEARTFTISRAIIEWSDEIQLLADVVGTPDWFRSEPMGVDPGDELELAISSEIERSMVTGP